MYPVDPTRFKNRFRIPSARRRGWDYALPGWYFITICTRDRMRCLGKIQNGRMRLSQMGCIVRDEWYRTERIRPDVTMDAFVVMPNHIHGIIVINRNLHFVETHCDASLPGAADPDVGNHFGPQTDNLPSIIRGYKSSTTTIINRRFGPNAFAWQPRYHDRIIRDFDELERIRWYIRNNPRMWERDRNN